MSSNRTYSVRTQNDEMSEIRTLNLTIPQYGGTAIDEAFATMSGDQPKETLDGIKKEFNYADFLNDPERKGKRVSAQDWLSPDGYRHRVCCKIEDLEKSKSVDTAHSDIEAIVNMSIALGQLVEHARLRQEQLSNVVRGTKVVKGAEAAGNMSRGRQSDETKRILMIMRNAIAGGASVSNAAREAKREVPGKKLGSYTKLYNRHRQK